MLAAARNLGEREDGMGDLFNRLRAREKVRYGLQAKNDVDSSGLPIMTPEALRQAAVDDEGYETPELNDRLYLHFKGYRKIQNLEPYTSLKALWLEGNGLSEIDGISHLSELRCLYLQQNLISTIAGLDGLQNLAQLDLSQNRIEVAVGLSCLPSLHTLNLSKNSLGDVASVAPLSECPSLTNLDVSSNKLAGQKVLDVLVALETLVSLSLGGNPVVSETSHFRKTVITAAPHLRYLDRPIFDAERVAAKAWTIGGAEAEREARAKFQEDRRNEDRRQMQIFRDWQAEQRAKKLAELEARRASGQGDRDRSPDEIRREQERTAQAKVDAEEDRRLIKELGPCKIADALTAAAPDAPYRETMDKLAATLAPAKENDPVRTDSPTDRATLNEDKSSRAENTVRYDKPSCQGGDMATADDAGDDRNTSPHTLPPPPECEKKPHSRSDFVSEGKRCRTRSGIPYPSPPSPPHGPRACRRAVSQESRPYRLESKNAVGSPRGTDDAPPITNIRKKPAPGSEIIFDASGDRRGRRDLDAHGTQTSNKRPSEGGDPGEVKRDVGPGWERGSRGGGSEGTPEEDEDDDRLRLERVAQSLAIYRAQIAAGERAEQAMRSDAERPAAPVTMTRRPRDDAETRSWASPENVNVNPVPLAATDPRWTTEQDRELVKAVLECEYDFGEVARRISAKHLEAMTEGEEGGSKKDGLLSDHIDADRNDNRGDCLPAPEILDDPYDANVSSSPRMSTRGDRTTGDLPAITAENCRIRFAALDLGGIDADAAVGDTREDVRSTRQDDYANGRAWERGESAEGMSYPREDAELGDAFTRGLGSPISEMMPGVVENAGLSYEELERKASNSVSRFLEHPSELPSTRDDDVAGSDSEEEWKDSASGAGVKRDSQGDRASAVAPQHGIRKNNRGRGRLEERETISIEEGDDGGNEVLTRAQIKARHQELASNIGIVATRSPQDDDDDGGQDDNGASLEKLH